jgi:hypothetical protein
MTKTDNKIVVGWLDSSICEIVRSGSLSRFGQVLITSLDSSRDLAEMEFGEKIRRFDPSCAFLGAGVAVPGRLIKSIEESLGLFFGFDEVWCFDDRVPHGKPPSVSIVAPLNFVEEGVSPELVEWMRASGCALGLGDGFGLNFVMSDVQFGTLLRAGIGE